MKDYDSHEIFKVIAVDYPDGQRLYEVEWPDENGRKASSGMHSEIDLMIEILKRMGKLDKNARIYVSLDHPKNPIP
jgi:hypothetical protein